MAPTDDHRRRARRTWSGGDWDSCASFVAPVGPVVLDRIGVGTGHELLDVGTGNGGSIAIPAALRGARVVGSDITPELFDSARRRAAEAGVDVDWVEADAQDLPFADDRFDRVTSTFGAMFAPDHAKAAAELVRVCKPGGRIGMATWATDGFFGEAVPADRVVHGRAAARGRAAGDMGRARSRPRDVRGRRRRGRDHG